MSTPIVDHSKSYPAGGWLAPGTPISWQRKDHGQDFVIPWGHVLQAPGKGFCLVNGSDVPYPNGFGPRFAVVHISTGRFAGNDWYLGHCTSLVNDGEQFGFGHPLARADQGHPNQIGIFPASPPGNGGWVELGQWINGRIGPDNGPSGHWYDHLLRTPLRIGAPVFTLRVGDHGPLIRILSARLRIIGLMRNKSNIFGARVHHAVVVFQRQHHLTPDGIVGAKTWSAIKRAAEAHQRGK